MRRFVDIVRIRSRRAQVLLLILVGISASSYAPNQATMPSVCRDQSCPGETKIYTEKEISLSWLKTMCDKDLGPRGVAFDPNSSSVLYVICEHTKKFYRLRLDTNGVPTKQELSIKLKGTPSFMLVSPDDRYIYVVTERDRPGIHRIELKKLKQGYDPPFAQLEKTVQQPTGMVIVGQQAYVTDLNDGDSKGGRVVKLSLMNFEGGTKLKVDTVLGPENLTGDLKTALRKPFAITYDETDKALYVVSQPPGGASIIVREQGGKKVLWQKRGCLVKIPVDQPSKAKVKAWGLVGAAGVNILKVTRKIGTQTVQRRYAIIPEFGEEYDSTDDKTKKRGAMPERKNWEHAWLRVIGLDDKVNFRYRYYRNKDDNRIGFHGFTWRNGKGQEADRAYIPQVNGDKLIIDDDFRGELIETLDSMSRK